MHIRHSLWALDTERDVYDENLFNWLVVHSFPSVIVGFVFCFQTREFACNVKDFPLPVFFSKPGGVQCPLTYSHDNQHLIRISCSFVFIMHITTNTMNRERNNVLFFHLLHNCKHVYRVELIIHWKLYRSLDHDKSKNIRQMLAWFDFWHYNRNQSWNFSIWPIFAMLNFEFSLPVIRIFERINGMFESSLLEISTKLLVELFCSLWFVLIMFVMWWNGKNECVWIRL